MIKEIVPFLEGTFAFFKFTYEYLGPSSTFRPEIFNIFKSSEFGYMKTLFQSRQVNVNSIFKYYFRVSRNFQAVKKGILYVRRLR
jgi:hypothetical protein